MRMLSLTSGKNWSGHGSENSNSCHQYKMSGNMLYEYTMQSQEMRKIKASSLHIEAVERQLQLSCRQNHGIKMKWAWRAGSLCRKLYMLILFMAQYNEIREPPAKKEYSSFPFSPYAKVTFQIKISWLSRCSKVLVDFFLHLSNQLHNCCHSHIP